MGYRNPNQTKLISLVLLQPPKKFQKKIPENPKIPQIHLYRLDL